MRERQMPSNTRSYTPKHCLLSYFTLPVRNPSLFWRYSSAAFFKAVKCLRLDLPDILIEGLWPNISQANRFYRARDRLTYRIAKKRWEFRVCWIDELEASLASFGSAIFNGLEWLLAVWWC